MTTPPHLARVLWWLIVLVAWLCVPVYRIGR